MTDTALPPDPLTTWQDVPPPEAEGMALFLDLDGTLLELAATPDAVIVPDDLVDDLAAAHAALGGALAIISGRDLASIDRLLAPLRLPAAGEHGAVIRLPDGMRDEIVAQVPEAWIDRLLTLQHTRPGVMIERKTHSVVAHFRNAPLEEEAIRRTAQDLVASDPQAFELLPGKMVFEIRPRHINKGRAVHKFMPMEPFRGRKPIFIGDDVTDEDGFDAVAGLGGIGLHVARNFDGQPREVRRWLKLLARS